jgi:hypothetical protein
MTTNFWVGGDRANTKDSSTIYAIGAAMDLRIKATARRADEGRDWNVALIVSEDCAGAGTAFENVQHVIGLAVIKAIREAKDRKPTNG